MLKSVTYFKNNELAIVFSNFPHVDFRYVTPQDTEEEKQAKLEKPFINLEELIVTIIYQPKNKKVKQYTFTIPENYTWDGASIPRLFWRLIGAKTDPRFVLASMVHDVLCENPQYIDYNRYLSTLVLEKLCQAGGASSVVCFLIKHSVDNFQKLTGRWKNA